MSLFPSFLIKLGMLAMTLEIVWWIGWQVPQTMQRPAVTHAAAFSSDAAAVTSTAVIEAASPSVKESIAPSAPRGPQRVDLNRATVAEFDQLPGVGPVLARRMVDYRRSVGRFYAIEDLRGVKGIGKKKFERLKPFVTVAASPTQDEGKKGPI